ncbi:chemotaxis protein CheR [Rhodospirillum rubrum]|uniref:CheR family methyltransferase n=1 Tax=Rhodospirillum rubrum TaxID=1085 RepID=UPI00190457CE|nr:protein-glutamate O-methyltransferase [Rhodospirillum rubrum]MBK1662922.1 chemotaxis protein CheR [Rhodospirillum rubrum]MBK1675209.1 chemotaxis protein CheR [Rhodospirillum rubrum]
MTTTGSLDHLSMRDFRRLATFIHDYSGIKMPESKKTMVEGRLRKRVSAIGAAHLTDYCHRLFDEGGLAHETLHLIDVITTNKTEFFREPQHFTFLAENALPQIVADRRAGPQTLIKVWSTASSIGAEPYTLAMVLADASQKLGGFRVNILATDISVRVLETAAAAIYPESMIAPVPMDMRKRYLMRSKDATRALVRIVPDLRRIVQFGRLNLMDSSYPVDQGLDVVFCRNMLIYFDKPTQQAVLTRLCNHLRPGGYLFLGHSESLAGFGLPLKAVGTTVFRRE